MKPGSPLEDPQLLSDTLETLESEYPKEISNSVKDVSLSISTSNVESEIDVSNDSYMIESGSNAELDFDVLLKMLSDTTHLELYGVMDSTLGLDGEAYVPLKKYLYYFENSVKQDTVSNRINIKTHIDNRAFMLIEGEASSGKSTIKNHIQKISDIHDYHEISGLSHEKQLIGTTVEKGKGKDKKIEAVLGIMAAKVVVNDETQEMINEKNEMYAHSQRIKRLAMDTYGDNTFTDKTVKTQMSERLMYCSPSRVLDLAHPKKFESPFFDNGTFRRYGLITILQPDKNIDLDSITDFKFDDSAKIDFNGLMDDFYKTKRNSVTFNEENLFVISNFHKALLYYLLKHKNQNAFRYGLLTRYSMRNMFCKNVLILAISRNEETPSLKTCVEACYDTLLFILESIKSINQLGNMGVSSDVWGGLEEENAQTLEYLFRRGATSQQTSDVSIKKFCTILGHLHGCKMTQARGIYYKLKRDNFIDSKQVGSNSSVVWLKFRPKEIVLDVGSYDPFEVWSPLFKGVSPKNTLLTPLKSIINDDKDIENLVGVGGVGVLGCILLKKYICVEVEEIVSYSYLFKGRGQNPKPLTPIPINKNLSSIKQPLEGVKTPILKPTPLNPQSDRDVQYFEAPECSDIKRNCDKEEVLQYLAENPKSTTQELILKFGVGVLQFKKEGLFK